MKANRKTMLGVALAVAVIALAGIGYAAVSGYTATTSSAGNNLNDVKYNVVSLSNYGNFMVTDLAFDTVTSAGPTTTYDFHNKTLKYDKTDSIYAKDTSATSGYNAIAVSNVLTVTPDISKGGAGELTLQITGWTKVTGIDFIVVVDGATTGINMLEAFATPQNIKTVESATPVTVQVFAVVTGAFTWVPASCANATFTFVLTAN